MILLVVEDVMFMVPLATVCRAHGLVAVQAVNAEEALQRLKENTVTAVLLDMRLTTDELVSHIPKTMACAAFGPHVEGAAFLALRRLGVKEVWPNSQLMVKFPRWLDRLTHPS